MISRYQTIYKKVGETPLVALERFRAEARIATHVPLAYAGRLDPMAEGKLLVLIGEECKHQKAYHQLDKVYEVEVLLGAKSDSGDVLGIVEASDKVHDPSASEVTKVLRALHGVQHLPYPIFSSKTVEGKPLFLWQLEGRIHEITIPHKTVRVHSITQHGTRNIDTEQLVTYAQEKIETIPKVIAETKRLGADFRRGEVRDSWSRLKNYVPERTFNIINIRVTASSGTYMRTLALIIGEQLGTTGLALSIKRTGIGHYVPLLGQAGFWIKKY